MMARRVGLVVAAIVGSAGAASAQAPILEPVAGIYDASVYVASTGVQGAGSCDDAAGAVAEGRKLRYPGTAGTVMKYWSTSGSSTPSILKEVFTITQSVGTTSVGGTFAASVFPSGLIYSGNFTAEFNFFDANSFTMQLVENYPTEGGGTCTEVLELSLARSGT